MEDLISEKDYQKSLQKGGEGWGRHKAPVLTFVIKRANTNKLCDFSKDLYSNNLLVT